MEPGFRSRLSNFRLLPEKDGSIVMLRGQGSELISLRDFCSLKCCVPQEAVMSWDGIGRGGERFGFHLILPGSGGCPAGQDLQPPG